MKPAKNWIRSLKISVIEKDLSSIESLVSNMPDFEDIGQMEEARALIAEAVLIANKEKSKLKKGMDNIKRSKKFLDLDKKDLFSKTY